MMRRLPLPFLVLLASCAVARGQSFEKLVGSVPVKEVRARADLVMPYITWGGDVALFVANGGTATKPGSVYHGLGVRLALKNGDDFLGQVRDYLSGESPFLRAEFNMIGAASEVLNADPRTKPVAVVQETWSAGGDCFVARPPVRSLNDLKRGPGQPKVRVALQRCGPHMGFLDAILKVARLTFADVEVVWCKDLTGEPAKGDHPAAAFRAGRADACFVISPDMIGLTSGPEATGSGKEGTVAGARVVLSTSTLNRGVADLIWVRKDFYDAHPELVRNVAAGYIKGTYDLMAWQKVFDAKKPAPKYLDALRLAQKIYGATVIPNIEIEGAGLVHDAEFAGIPGNVAFFRDRANQNNFERKQAETLTIANALGFASKRVGFLPAPWDWKDIASFAGVPYAEPDWSRQRIAENAGLLPGSEGAAGAIYSFAVNFDVDQDTFPADSYGDKMDECIRAANLNRNGVIVVRGHADPSKTLFDLVVALREKGKIKESGTGPDKRYFLDGKELDLSQTAAVTKLISETDFTDFPRQVTVRGRAVTVDNPKDDVSSMDTLSQRRADAFRKAVLERARSSQINLDPSQIQVTSVGIREPLIARPRKEADAKTNMRVEIQVRKVGGESLSSDLFNP